MKLNIVVLLILFGALSCKKEKKEPTPQTPPTLEISFGHEEGGAFQFIPFKDQSSVPHDSIAAFEHIAVTFSEKNLPGNKSYDTLKFAFDVKTTNDTEHFDSKTFMGNRSTTYLNFFSIEVTGTFYLPRKISDVAKPGNDTLEVKNGNDFITVEYQSIYSSLTGKKTLNKQP
jgi:hypothetical protein